MGSECSVWFSAVVRGDVNSIRMGNKVNIQDGAVLHCTYQKTKLQIDALRGMNITITTTAKTDEEARALLSAFSFPFRN